jgi:hypothetical protein
MYHLNAPGTTEAARTELNDVTASMTETTNEVTVARGVISHNKELLQMMSNGKQFLMTKKLKATLDTPALATIITIGNNNLLVPMADRMLGHGGNNNRLHWTNVSE